MKLSEFDFDLPEELIAQHPVKKRDTSRLMVVDRETGSIEHKHFYDIVDYLKPGDVLVRNNTKVIPARLFGIKEETNGHVEVLLLKELKKDTWECLCGNARIVKMNTVISFGEGLLKAKCIEIKDEGIRVFEMIYDGIFYEILDQLGTMPLPPYIKEKLADKDRYQTVYAKIEGSAAAPTAGLHFTDEINQKIIDKGVTILEVTLHVGLGTFRPVKVDNVLEHHMHSEYYMIEPDVADALNKAKAEGRRIIAVGTTSTRTLEANMQKYGKFTATHENTDIFIYPGYQYKAIDCLITNFHLPKSTLLMLISAFASKELIFKAYHEAIQEKYRFFSFGDSMFIK
ncbi:MULTISPECIES: tRNA preQ1(34) S-adenosylmethionine ribosyltransferase-isomerase QueA [Coprobacillaceae]|uniref:tRNA preQ1(34) S-adenosylmethionine ribosyltransferase-isomerase QueA n=1 Tax=Coprobacillaceae TaxID=2810280 RepID=UPI000E4A491B|nr:MULTISPECIES: tRNA preQ1(34) S-adenosylmethionine ribosyltransferase-isomerase QueA [Coprobacillaceae]RHM61165.1 tRNA preQ1(34) S-adenosylmethionine ribosyltransferase-isomerase QueA [Coprobacillus sp. AF33-1AC]RHS91952.1 tRNA preQ1(34) S-adenosylmethionine ribosyltransferase-isomerase QueA [Erysipelatoclostridium sp. AM42-17]